MCTTTLSSAEQKLTALDRANAIRFARAELKRAIASGELAAGAVILNPPAAAQGWPIVDMLRSQRGWGRQRTLHLLTRAGIAELKPVGALTPRQRELLAALLGYESERT